MSESIEEKLARIERGETFQALRSAGKIALGVPAAGEGVARSQDQYPYAAKSLLGQPGTESLRHETIERKGIRMRVPIIESAQQEREFGAKYGYRRT